MDNLRVLEIILQCMKMKKPFFMLRVANSDIITLLVQNSDEKFTKTPASHYAIFAPFDRFGDRIVIPADHEYSFVWKSNTSKNPSTLLKPDASESQLHQALVRKALVAIQSESFLKVVLSRKRNLKTNRHLNEIVERLLNNFTSANCYVFHHPKVGTWLGATPETLLTVNNKSLKTMSLAGTLPYEGTDVVSWTSKELQEQALVTQFIEKKLKNLGLSAVNSGKVYTTRAGNLWHLKNDITAEIANIKSSEILDALHPTPAVCGVPVPDAFNFIKQHELYDREFYTGYLGIKNNDSEHYFVNLRCAQWHTDHTYTLYAGGGITASSIPENEYIETINKMNTLYPIFAD